MSHGFDRAELLFSRYVRFEGRALSSVVALPRREQDRSRRLVAEHLGRRIRRRRRVMGLTQNELARALGLPFEAIQKLETASVGLSEAELQRLASVLMTPVSYFYSGLDDEPATLAIRAVFPVPSTQTRARLAARRRARPADSLTSKRSKSRPSSSRRSANKPDGS